jgi:8-oxo-dGTP pyrophosphatase MutT (NUDIX family)
MLECYRRVFPAETAVVDRFVALVEAHADCFERTCRPGHITGAAWIVSADRRHYLLAHHRKLDRWLQLGGHADGQAQIDQVALREAREESGMTEFELVPISGALVPLDLDVHKIPARYDAAGNFVEDAHEHHDVRFLMVAHAGQKLQVSNESHEVRWFTSEEVLRLTDEESVLRMMYKAARILD